MWYGSPITLGKNGLFYERPETKCVSNEEVKYLKNDADKFTGEQDIGNGRAIIPLRGCRCATEVSFPFGNESCIWQITDICDRRRVAAIKVSLDLFHTLPSTRYFDCHLFPHHLSNIHIYIYIHMFA